MTSDPKLYLFPRPVELSSVKRAAVLAASKADAALDRAVTAGEPAHVAKYAFQIAQAFNNFYHQYPIIHEQDREKKVFLLWMTDFFRAQLERTLGVLGIEVPPYM